jgi:hypothetical protein
LQNTLLELTHALKSPRCIPRCVHHGFLRCWPYGPSSIKAAEVYVCVESKVSNVAALAHSVRRLATGVVRGSSSGWCKISRTRPDRYLGPPSHLYNGYWVIPGGKSAGLWRWPPTPSNARLKKEYSPTCTPLCLQGLFWGEVPLHLYLYLYRCVIADTRFLALHKPLALCVLLRRYTLCCFLAFPFPVNILSYTQLIRTFLRLVISLQSITSLSFCVQQLTYRYRHSKSKSTALAICIPYTSPTSHSPPELCCQAPVLRTTTGCIQHIHIRTAIHMCVCVCSLLPPFLCFQ